jgi:hypothetical protein
VTIAPPTEAVVVDPHDVVVELGLLTVSERKSLDVEIQAAAATTTTTTTTTQAGAPLAGTGANVTGLLLIALGLLLAGGSLIVGSRRISHRRPQ